MGLIKALTGAAGSVVSDTFKELFVCDSMDSNTIMKKGTRQLTSRSGNKHSNDNIITNGSGVVIADGQCMMIVDNGQIVEFCAEPGVYTYDNSTEPTIFCGDLKKGIIDSFEKFKVRFAYGGDTGHDQRVYFANIKEMTGNKFGTPNPIPLRIVDERVGLDFDLELRCSGVYSWKLTDPIVFYKNVSGNVSDDYTVDMISEQLKTEFISGLQPSIGQLSQIGLRPNEIPGHVEELCDFMNQTLNEKWNELRGISIVSIAMNNINLKEEDAELVKTAQKAGMMTNPAMAAAMIAEAQAQAMKDAALNDSGAFNGFMGMNLAAGLGGGSVNELFDKAEAMQSKTMKEDGWKCECGTNNSGNFCSNCGNKRPDKPAAKFCSNCGNRLNTGVKFCNNCGNKVE